MIRFIIFVVCWAILAQLGETFLELESFPVIMLWGLVSTVIAACVTGEFK